MSALWPYWFRPWWLLLLPLLGWLLWQLWHRQKRAGRWQMILPPAFHAALLSGGNGRDSKLPWVVLGLAWILTVLALLGPSWQRVEQISQKPADPLVVVLELTPEMLATDVAPNRLEQARRKLLDLLQVRSDAQTAIVVYAGSAHTLVPLSDDLSTSRNLLDALKPSLMPEAGHRADLAVTKALALLSQGGLGEGRILLIGSTLTDLEREGIRQALDRKSTQFLMLGIGTAEGAPVAQEDGSFLKDDQGAILVPYLDSPSLKAFANELGGRYRPARLGDTDLRGLGLLDGPRTLRNDGQTLRLDTWADQGYWLLLPLLLLAACAGRRGWLFCLPLLFLLPQPSYAFDFEDLWLRPDQRGLHLLRQGHPAKASQHFEDPQWQGVALYEAGDYSGAAQRFAEGNDAHAHYNRGNALAKSGELEAALDAYDQALERQPDLRPAQTNKALVESLLKQKNAPPPVEPQKSADDETKDTEQETPPGAATQPADNTPPKSDAGQTTPDAGQQATTPPKPGANEVPGSELGDEQSTTPPMRPASDNIDGEQRQALEQWLRKIPDDPGELLRRKFWYEQQQHQDQEKTR
ncbi:MAG: tetratricopeptide repeat protein [Gammaproteobacteria bacterium]|uniref:Tetratricopeptide repeat protein n=2 Tax=Pseudomonas mandelii TaxID=75612 RepID=A0AB36D2T8_9PSED|nr:MULTISPECIES: tetratricopeptide repeat protein [Pseudomonas]MBU0522245.1 tetratricopeptide repeat protein [Gammaproteobacteria bacterium]MBU0817920.1 tetratricopeptide repeat protein [Gammaproteobacteria bacterium]MBU0842990.1 tetratricopeptide repeat protein [Gammaproteobacteria bacterium]MBU1838771.1 tetratricopeptide repeat protein [Gammaproteobacteria bacterium]MDO8403436.1 tetratricopeptide repeat protein [Pseudomonas sp.]